MKFIIRSLTFLFLIPSLCIGEETAPLRKGDDAVRITEILGTPDGFMETGSKGVYYFDRGEVHTRDGKVTFIFLISEEELAEQRHQEAVKRQQRRVEGKSAYEAILAQGNVNNLSGKDQLRFWQDFSQKYPEVNTNNVIAKARRLATAERVQEEEAERVARLEKRVLQAELRAAQAQENAARAQQVAVSNSNRTRYNLGTCVVLPSVVYRGRSHYRVNRPVPYVKTGNGVKGHIGFSPRVTGDTTLISRHLR